MQLKFFVSALVCVALAAPSAHAQSLEKAFTYQGRLNDEGSPANGSYDLQFTLNREEAGGSIVAGPICVENVDVQDGLFTALVNFDAEVFNGDALWLEIGVRADGTPGNCATGGYAVLTPRQPLTAAPNALFALNAATAYDATLLSGLPAAFYQNASNMSSGTLSDERQSANVCLLDREQSFTDEKHFAARPTFDAAGVPFTVESTGLVNNLNADLLDGLSSSAFLHWSAAGADVHNTNAGNVGIGITTPAEKLSVAGTIESTTGGFKFPDASRQKTALRVTAAQTAVAVGVTAGGAWQNIRTLNVIAPGPGAVLVTATGYVTIDNFGTARIEIGIATLPNSPPAHAAITASSTDGGAAPTTMNVPFTVQYVYSVIAAGTPAFFLVGDASDFGSTVSVTCTGMTALFIPAAN